MTNLGRNYYPSERELQQARQRANPETVYSIEGESVTMAQIAERLGLDRNRATSRLRRERMRADRVTWEGLAR